MHSQKRYNSQELYEQITSTSKCQGVLPINIARRDGSLLLPYHYETIRCNDCGKDSGYRK